MEDLEATLKRQERRLEALEEVLSTVIGMRWHTLGLPQDSARSMCDRIREAKYD